MNTLTYHKGWEIRWSGWLQVPNQICQVGTWIAFPPVTDESTAGRPYIVHTTTGCVSQVRGLESWPIQQHPDWPVIDVRSSDTERARLKALALDSLKRKLDA